MDLRLSEEQQMLLDMVRKMSKDKITPRAEGIDEKDVDLKDFYL